MEKTFDKWIEKTRQFILSDCETLNSLKRLSVIAYYLRNRSISRNITLLLYMMHSDEIPVKDMRLYSRFEIDYKFLSEKTACFLSDCGRSFIHTIINYILINEIEEQRKLIERDVADELEEMENAFKKGRNKFLISKNYFVCKGQQLIDDFEPESDSNFDFYLIDSCTIKYNQIIPTDLYLVKLPHDETRPFVFTMAEHIEYITRNELEQKLKQMILDDWLDILEI